MEIRRMSFPVGCCEECAYYLDYKDVWQCNGGVGKCSCHPEIQNSLIEAARVARPIIEAILAHHNLTEYEKDA